MACLVVDRDRVRARIRAAGDRSPTTGFRLGPRGWRIAAGFLFGCACAVKWSGVYFLAFFAVLSLFWDRAAWREAGVPRPTRTALRRGLPGAPWALGAVPVLTYLASFTGWFLGETSQGKAWAQQHPHTAFPFIPDALRSLWHQHAEWLTFHNGLSTPAPVAVRARGRGWSTAGRSCCGTRRASPTPPASQIVRYILMVGHADPLVRLRPGAAAGWSGGSSPGATRRRSSWRSAIAAGWLTWFINLERTMFIFYMAPAVPFFVLAVTLALQDVIGRRPGADRRRRADRARRGRASTSRSSSPRSSSSTRCSPGSPLPHAQWLLRMWFPSWF